MTINEAQDEVIEEFNDFTDWMDKYQMLIDLGSELDALDEQHKNDSNLIDGCQSRVWIQCDVKEGRLFFDRIGLREHLSPTRSNGLLAMVKRIKAYALVYANA